MSDSKAMIKPTMHHVNLKTNRLKEMIEWYALVVGTKVNFQFPGGAFISNDRANHRIALLAVPGSPRTRKSLPTQGFIIPPSSTVPSPI